MANLFRIKTTRRLPNNPTIVEKDGRKFVQIKRNGRRINRPLLDCGSRYRDESLKWYIQFRDTDGTWKRVAGYTDKEATRQLAADIERKVERKQSGLEDPFEAAAVFSLDKHVDDFRDYLNNKGDSPKHVSQTHKRIKRTIKGCEFRFWKDISASNLVAWLAEQRSSGTFGRKTSNYYQSAMKEFCTWMVKEQRAGQSPLTHLSALSIEEDVRRQRRAVSPDEFKWLIGAAATGPTTQCVSGEDRALLYILAAWTGFRRKELASLTIDSFELDGDPPVVRVAAAYSKRKRNDSIPLHPTVVEVFRRHLENRQCLIEDHVFPLKTKTGYMRRTSK